MKAWSVLLGALFVIASVSAGDESKSSSTKSPMMQSFNDLKWSALPERPGMQFAVLSGDPKAGPYTQIRKVPANTANPLHSHSSDLTNVIISGTWYTGADEASARDFGPGSVVFMPGNWVHVSGCRAESDCVFYQDGKGKFDFQPASAKPDP
jgi:quercetin dioxygenase-like cupin family protein